MSLVNDMLRDLDQRRKQTDGSTAASTLTPVPETIPEKARQPVYIYLVLALVLAGVAIVWFWLQQDGAQSARQLEITPNVVVQPSPVESSTQQSGATTENSAPATTTNAPQIQESAPSTSDIASSMPSESAVGPDTIATGSGEADEGLAANSSDASVAIQQSPRNSVTQMTDEEDLQQTELQSAEAAVSSDTDRLAANSVAAATESASNQTIDLTAAPTEDVKSDAALTPEERDVLAVQEALRLIANNQLTGAYQVLEQQVLDNRYAHQTRETYAKLLLNEGNLQGAYELVESGLSLSANHAGFKKIKARLLIANGELNEAVSLLITRAPEVSRDLEYHDILATAQLASRDYQGALISYTELVQQDQTQGKWWYGFAASQDLLGNTNAAKQGYSQAVSLPNLSANLRRRSQERLASLD